MSDNQVLISLYENGGRAPLADLGGAQDLQQLQAEGMIEITDGVVRLLAEVVEEPGIGSYGDGVFLVFLQPA